VSNPADLLQPLLQTPQARAWLERLIACFFEREAKSRLLDEVRAGLPALVPDLDEAARRALQGGFIQELCRRGSLSAARPPRETASFTPLSGPALGQRASSAPTRSRSLSPTRPSTRPTVPPRSSAAC
jgi:hypothetical protein